MFICLFWVYGLVVQKRILYLFFIVEFHECMANVAESQNVVLLSLFIVKVVFVLVFYWLINCHLMLVLFLNLI